MRESTRGFTLIELVVALSIFAILSVMCYSSLNVVLDTGAHTEARLARFRAIQTTIQMLEHDIANASERGVRDAFGDREAAIRGRPDSAVLLELTRRDPADAFRVRAVPLQRVSYRLQDGVLERLLWPVLDRTQANEPVVMRLADEVTELTFSFRQAEQWVEAWPPVAGSPNVRLLPRAVRLELVLEDGRRAQRTILLGGADA